ncbi:MAG: ferredoxin reductase family protein [Phycisphaerales bacterium]|nr:ferredoxin reductase family protein [Phycisphaerales bacterium]
MTDMRKNPLPTAANATLGVPGLQTTAPLRYLPGSLILGLYAVALIGPLALAMLNPTVPAGRFTRQIALGLGLFGLMIFATSFILAARYQWISRPFGLDAVLLFHRRMAVAGLFAILLHVALMATRQSQLITKLWIPWHLQLGRIALLAVVTQVGASLYRMRLHVEFERWRFSHRLVALIVLVSAFAHGLYSSEAFAPLPLRILVLTVVAAALISLFWTRAVRPALPQRLVYELAEVRSLGKAVWQLQLKALHPDQQLRYLPGQFAFFSLPHAGAEKVSEEHAWTIASSPTEAGGLTLAIKELGDFTATVGRLRPGGRVLVHGPFGRFSHALHATNGREQRVFIAAGIGITPFRSMLRYMADGPGDASALLIYGNRTQDDIVFRDELTQIEQSSAGAIRVVHVLSKADAAWNGERGHIDIATIRRHCDFARGNPSFWICGPGPFTQAMVNGLLAAGIRPTQIHTEAFCLVHAPVHADGRGRTLKRTTTLLCAAAAAMILLFALVSTDFLSARGGHRRMGHFRQSTTRPSGSNINKAHRDRLP